MRYLAILLILGVVAVSGLSACTRGNNAPYTAGQSVKPN